MPLTIFYQPISVGKLRLWTNFEMSFQSLGQYGTFPTLAAFCIKLQLLFGMIVIRVIKVSISHAGIIYV